MSTHDSQSTSVETLAEEFLIRLRAGENPSVDEYVKRYPDLADDIREFFPTLRLVENFKPNSRDDLVSTKSAGQGECSSTLQPPLRERLGDYRIVREVSRGGMGVVYEAVQESLGRPVALKVLPPHGLVDAQKKQRFVREARAAARLHHTNIVPVFGVGEADGVHYYAMQYINGLSLDRVLSELRRLRAEGARPVPTGVRLSASYSEKPSSNANRGLTVPGQDVEATCIAHSLMSGCFVRNEQQDVPGEEGTNRLTTNLQPNELAENLQADLPDTQEHRSAIDDTQVERSTDSTTFALPGVDDTTSGFGSITTYWHSVARIGVQVAEALQYAHEHGILHRDIKPSNLLLDPSGTAWVTDFGLAKADDQINLTRDGDVLGTLRYMPPELFHSKGDFRSDVYSLGLTLYEMLAMHPAFDETNRHKLVRQVMHESPPQLRTIDRRIPSDLELIVDKAIDPDPNHRYSSAGELSADLRRFLADEPIHARRISSAARFRRWCRRNPTIAGLTAAIALLLVIVGIGGASWAIHAETARQRIATAEDDATRRLFDSYVAQASASRASKRSGQRVKCLDALEQAAALMPRLGVGDEQRLMLRNEAIAAMGLIDLVEGDRFKLPARDLFVTCDSNMTLYACNDISERISVRRLKDHKQVSLTTISSHPADSLPRSLTSNGRFLVACDIGKGWIWDVARDEITLEFETSENLKVFELFSCQGDTLAVISPDESVHIFDVPSATRVQTLPTHARGVAVSHDGTKVAVAFEQNSGVQIWDCQSGRPLRILTIPWCQSMAWSPNGKLLACVVEDDEYDIFVWNVHTGKLCAELDGHQNGGLRFCFSEDSSILASASWDGTARLWDPLVGIELMRAEGSRCEFHAEGALMLTDSVNVDTWRLTSSPVCQTLRAADDRSDIYFLDSDFWWGGPLLVCARGDGLRFWNLVTNREIAFAPIGPTLSILFHEPSGSLITCRNDGVYQWPIEPSNRSSQWRIGPPRKLFARHGGQAREANLAQSRDGSRLAAVVDHHRPKVFSLGDSQSINTLGRHHDVSNLAVSPNGQCVVSGTSFDFGIRVWDADTCSLTVDLWPDCYSGTVLFSPQGDLLAAWDIQEIRIFETESWKLLRRFSREAIGHVMTWSVDGRWLAYSGKNLARLIDASTGSEIATITSPNEAGNIQSINLDRSGSNLAVTYRNAVEVWDLQLMRNRLAGMNLDWKLPPLPAKPMSQSLPEQIEFELGVLAL